jgi:pyruvate dehydrogenase E2 component (dihydrolipoamide acetyltransferase)
MRLLVAISITVPRLGWSMEEGVLVGWIKKDGDPVKPGDRLFSLESDKATEDIEAIDAGILRIPADAPKPGEPVRVGQVLGYLTTEGEAIPALPREQRAPGSIVEKREREPAVHDPPTRQSQAISPRARRLAVEMKIDYTTLMGSGSRGRIRERDVLALAAKLPGQFIAHTPLRRLIAQRMVAGITVAAPVTLFSKVDVTELVNMRRRWKTQAGYASAPSYTDIVLKCVAQSLLEHPLLRAQWRDDGLFIPDHIDIAFAVDTERGLLAPIVRKVDTLNLEEIAAHTRDLLTRARRGTLSADEMRNAIFTVSNLGNLGVDAFTPIIHLPQCAVLGSGRIACEPVVVEGKVMPRDMLTLSLTFDHRVVDGAPAARFLKTLSSLLQAPLAEMNH